VAAGTWPGAPSRPSPTFSAHRRRTLLTAPDQEFRRHAAKESDSGFHWAQHAPTQSSPGMAPPAVHPNCEAVDRFPFDARWKYAAGGLDFDYPGFVHTVLVDMRARLGRSQRPDRIFEVTLEVAKAAGLVGRKRVLDSTPLYDAVATMDTVTLIRSAIRGLLKVVEADLERELRGRLCGGDDYASCGKPVCDYDDPAARQALVDALAGDAMALLDALDGRELDAGVSRAAQLLATVVGQDLDCDGRRGSPRSRSLDARFVTVLQVPQGPCLPTLMGGEDSLRLKNWDAKNAENVA
jgi:hypothetical protein